MKMISIGSPRVLLLALPALVASLSGCGDNLVAGIDAGGQPTAAVTTVGAVTSTGQFSVNGREFDVSAATITVDGQSATPADLKLGQVVAITFRDTGAVASAESVDADDLVEGRIESIDLIAGEIELLGQLVLIEPDTLFDGETRASLSELSIGDVIEVSGFLTSANSIVATRIEQEGDSDDYEIVGFVSDLDTAANRFMINDLVVDFGAAMLEGFGGGIATGDLVEVEGDDYTNGVAFASSVSRERDVRDDDADEYELEGLITRFVSATDFDVQGIPVTTDAATDFENGSAADLALDVRVEVEGRPNAGGVIVADEIEFRAMTSAKVEATVDLVDASQGALNVFTIEITQTSSTIFKDEGPLELERFSLDDISDGDFVEVIGQESASGLIATLIKRKSPEDSLKLKGVASAISDPQFTVLGVTVMTNAQTSFEGDNDQSIDAATFFANANGRRVEVQGDRVGDILMADEVELD